MPLSDEPDVNGYQPATRNLQPLLEIVFLGPFLHWGNSVARSPPLGILPDRHPAPAVRWPVGDGDQDAISPRCPHSLVGLMEPPLRHVGGIKKGMRFPLPSDRPFPPTPTPIHGILSTLQCSERGPAVSHVRRVVVCLWHSHGHPAVSPPVYRGAVAARWVGPPRR